MKNNKKFISIAWSYHKHMQEMAPEESYHLHMLKVAKEVGFKPYILLRDGRIFLETDPHFDPDITIIDYKNFCHFLYQVIKFSLQGALFYVNSYEWQSFIVPFISRKTIFMAHTQPKRQTVRKQKIQNFVCSFFTAIRLNNVTEKEFLLTQKTDPAKLHVIPLVVSTDVFKVLNTTQEQIRKDLVYFGNITVKKDVLTIIKAFESVKAVHPDIKLHIIGNVLDSRVTAHAETSPYVSDIVFHGFVKNEEVVQKLNTYLMYINSSFDEGQCVAVYDAALCGLGLCLPNIMSFIDVYKDKAVFHDVQDHTTLAKNILYYINNPDILTQHNRKCIDMITQEYSTEIIEKKLQALLLTFA
jgi:glycosyltransferase involved in cell wall biosynthesis